jgi:DNA-binding beta-propeller fold protein YncE
MRFRQLFLHSTFIVVILLTFNLRSQLVEAQTKEPTPQSLTLVWQTKFQGDAVLASPGDVAVDEKGNSYVSTQGGNRIKKFDSDGNFVTQWGIVARARGTFLLR